MSIDHPDDTFAKVWFDCHTAARYVPCKSLKAWRQWKRRHGIVARANGSVAKRDIDRALNMKKATRRGLHPNSLANLSKRKVA